MLILAMIFYLGLTIGADTWFWWLFGICAFFKIIGFGIEMFKLGSKE